MIGDDLFQFGQSTLVRSQISLGVDAALSHYGYITQVSGQLDSIKHLSVNLR